MKCPKSRVFLYDSLTCFIVLFMSKLNGWIDNYWAGWVEQSKFEWNCIVYRLQCKQFQFVDSILFGQVRFAVFFRALSKYFFSGQRWLKPPRKNRALHICFRVLYSHGNSVLCVQQCGWYWMTEQMNEEVRKEWTRTLSSSVRPDGVSWGTTGKCSWKNNTALLARASRINAVDL